jgi:cytochrome c oxidase subunit 2
MTSRDVIHGFYLPEFRLKQDILPGQYTYLYLQPDREGSYDIFCTQYCGVGHSTMRAKLIVMSPAEHAKWESETATAARADQPLSETGRKLLAKHGCLACHSAIGTAKDGPTFQGLYGRKVALEGDREVVADEEYLRESIEDPGAKIVRGFPNVMPPFKGRISGDEVTAIIAYLKTISEGKPPEEMAEKREIPPEEKGKALAAQLGCLSCHSTDGSKSMGPTWKGLYGSRVPLEDGRTVKADERFLRESILDPQAKIVKGFPPAMPAFRGRISDDDVAALIAFLKTLK